MLNLLLHISIKPILMQFNYSPDEKQIIRLSQEEQLPLQISDYIYFSWMCEIKIDVSPSRHTTSLTASKWLHAHI